MKLKFTKKPDPIALIIALILRHSSNDSSRLQRSTFTSFRFASLAEENPFVVRFTTDCSRCRVSSATIPRDQERACAPGAHCSSNAPLVTDSACWLRIRPMRLRFINIDVPRNASEFAGMHAARRICGERVIQRGRSALRRLDSATKLTPRVTSQFAGSSFVSLRDIGRTRASFSRSSESS
jgi:hypothetical protein